MSLGSLLLAASLPSIQSMIEVRGWVADRTPHLLLYLANSCLSRLDPYL